MSVSERPMMFKAGQKVIRNREAQIGWQRDNWEKMARRCGFDPYGPVEVLSVDHPSTNITITEVGSFTWWKPALFTPVLIDKELEDYL
jgi:hypothetical protein